MPLDSEYELMQRLSAGNEDAFGELFGRYYPRVCAFVGCIVKEESTAEDIAQDIFLKIWERRDMVKVDKRSGRVTSMRFPGGTFANGIDDGHLTFINSRLSDIARQLERTFDVKIVIDSQQLADERYYSVFINHETLDEILSILEQNGDMKHRREGEMIHLYKK